MNNQRTKFLSRLGFEHPIIQAPMAGVSSPAMAAAVSNAGALGSIGFGAVDAEGAGEMIDATRKLTDRSFHVNVFCHQPALTDATRESAWLERLRPEFVKVGAEPPSTLREIYRSFLVDDATLELLLTTRPAVLSFHFGLPTAAKLKRLRDAGIFLLASATNLEDARTIAAAGVDAVIAQGYEAGGHRGMFDLAKRDDKLPG